MIDRAERAAHRRPPPSRPPGFGKEGKSTLTDRVRVLWTDIVALYKSSDGFPPKNAGMTDRVRARCTRVHSSPGLPRSRYGVFGYFEKLLQESRHQC